MRAAAILLAAGSGERLGLGVPKAFVEHAGRPLLLHTLATIAGWPELEAAVVVVPPGWIAETRRMVAAEHGLPATVVVAGGATRQESVRLGLRAVSDDIEAVLCHDAARPFATSALFDRVLRELERTGADGVVPVVPSPDTVKRVRARAVLETIVRNEIGLAQTPQAFRADALRQSHRDAAEQGVAATDDAMLLERAGYRVVTVPGDPRNFKVTTVQNLEHAVSLPGGRPSAGTMRAAGEERVAPDIKVGLGLDLHRRSEAGTLVLGGVRFEGEPALAGHSDGDVVCHAVADALLGAAGLGDLGEHFPDTDPAFAGIAGFDIVRRVMALLAKRRLAPRGCDVTVLADRPPVSPRREEIRRNLGAALSLPVEAVSVKATRPEGLGLTGDGAGCLAVVTVASAQR